MDTLDFVLASQSASGAFRSTAHVHDERHDDENAFVTALVALELSSLHDDRADDAVTCACEFLLRCRRENGSFGFYPRDEEPCWIGGRIAADADDTALCTLLLLDRGAIDEDEALRILDALEPFRLHYRPESEHPWVQRGAQRTWLDERTWPNPVDVCVNANVAALLARLGCRNALYDAAWRTVDAGVEWFLLNPALLRYLTPFYPEAFEVREAVRRAVRAGASELAASFERIDSVAGFADDDPILCSSHGGAYAWRAPALQAARRLVSLTQERRADVPQRIDELFTASQKAHGCAQR